MASSQYQSKCQFRRRIWDSCRAGVGRSGLDVRLRLFVELHAAVRLLDAGLAARFAQLRALAEGVRLGQRCEAQVNDDCIGVAFGAIHGRVAHAADLAHVTAAVEGANGDWVAEYMVPWVASGSPHGREIALKWIESKDETIASAGWQTYSSMVAIKEDADLDLAEIKSLLQRVAKSIHQQPNRVKFVMNGFVIAVACYVKPLHKLAVDTANGIGKVAVDLVGACKIPFAPDHIKKFEARSAIGKKRKSPKC